jgi:hypothetical protein
MRQVYLPKVNGLNDSLHIEVLDDPGAGGANHHYAIYGWHGKGNPSAGPLHDETKCAILFQNGPVAEAGVNGVSQEALLAILIDRLQCFQAGKYSCRENALALTKLEEAMLWLRERTLKRVDRGVEGTSTV